MVQKTQLTPSVAWGNTITPLDRQPSKLSRRKSLSYKIRQSKIRINKALDRWARLESKRKRIEREQQRQQAKIVALSKSTTTRTHKDPTPLVTVPEDSVLVHTPKATPEESESGKSPAKDHEKQPSSEPPIATAPVEVVQDSAPPPEDPSAESVPVKPESIRSKTSSRRASFSRNDGAHGGISRRASRQELVQRDSLARIEDFVRKEIEGAPPDVDLSGCYLLKVSPQLKADEKTDVLGPRCEVKPMNLGPDALGDNHETRGRSLYRSHSSQLRKKGSKSSSLVDQSPERRERRLHESHSAQLRRRSNSQIRKRTPSPVNGSPAGYRGRSASAGSRGISSDLTGYNKLSDTMGTSPFPSVPPIGCAPVGPPVVGCSSVPLSVSTMMAPPF